MTIQNISNMREQLGFSLITNYVMDSECNDILANDIINYNVNKILSLQDVGFIIPKSASLFENGSCREKDYMDDSGISYFGLNQAICVNSSKTYRNLISKNRMKFITPVFRKSGFIGALTPTKMYIWRYGNIYLKDSKVTNDGYELVVINDKLQIESRSYYLCFD